MRNQPNRHGAEKATVPVFFATKKVDTKRTRLYPFRISAKI